MYCHKCGKEIPDDADYCPHCGTENIYKPKAPSKRLEDEEGYISFGVDEKGNSLRTDPLSQQSKDGKIVTTSNVTRPYRDKKWSIVTLVVLLVVTIILAFTPVYKGYGSIVNDYHINEADWMFFLFAIIFIDMAFYMIGYTLIAFINPAMLLPAQQKRMNRGSKVGISIATVLVLVIGIIFLVMGVVDERLSAMGILDIIFSFTLGALYVVVVLFEQCDILHKRK
ncbi:MAG: zinc ribbon domain-containing protein [Coprobacillus sp.]|nr:zinc ribbon domain-containing protein [Coprobacillus sp.]